LGDFNDFDRTIALREHLVTILTNNQLTLFPSQLLIICEYIRTPRALLEDPHIDYFIKVANSATTVGSNMVSILSAPLAEMYAQSVAIEDDVQILYEGAFKELNVDKSSNNPTAKDYDEALATGHYICIHYIATENNLYIYDSLKTGTHLHYLKEYF